MANDVWISWQDYKRILAAGARLTAQPLLGMDQSPSSFFILSTTSRGWLTASLAMVSN
jgi:hypothetical protein